MEYKLIANEIKDTLKVNVFENSRKRPIIDARSLFCYILRKDFNLTLHSIADIYKSKGKNYNHATVIHSVNNYDIASKDDRRLEEIRAKVLKLTNPQAVLINRIRDIYDTDRLQGLHNLIDLQEEQLK
jgi:chromosomal replication initiation ATPase DnaA